MVSEEDKGVRELVKEIWTDFKPDKRYTRVIIIGGLLLALLLTTIRQFTRYNRPENLYENMLPAGEIGVVILVSLIMLIAYMGYQDVTGWRNF